MLAKLVNFMGNISRTPQIKPIQTSVSNNPFANPFVSQNSYQSGTYGKNKPLTGGLFAGYYNGKPNIVGSRLFIEV
jgi:hypothetical protein